MDRLVHAKPIDVERNQYRQELLNLASKRVTNLQQYVVSVSPGFALCLSHFSLFHPQRFMQESIKEQEKAAKAGLEYLQVQANKEALEAECKGQSDEIAIAQGNFIEST